MKYHDFNYESNINVLRGLFNQISGLEIHNILKNSSVKKYQKNDLIINNNTETEALYILLDGIIQIGYLSSSGRFHAFNYYSEKKCINLFACLQDQVPEYHYYAFNQVKVLVIPKQIFLDQINQSPTLSKEVMSLLALRMHHLMAEIKFMHILNLHQKVAKTLFNLARQYGGSHPLGVEIKLKISQHDLADLLSSSRQTINKEIKKLVDLDVLNWQYENIIIKDLDYFESQIQSL